MNIPLLSKRSLVRLLLLLLCVDIIVHLIFNLTTPHYDQHNNETYCRPQQYMIYIKVHKTGSSTVMNILQRFGLARNLSFILPRVKNYLGYGKSLPYPPNTQYFNSQILIPPNNEAFHILCNHVVYNHTAFNATLSGRHLVNKETSNLKKVREVGNRKPPLLFDFIPFLKYYKKTHRNEESLCYQNFATRKLNKLCHKSPNGLSEVKDYFYFASIRQPLQQVISAVDYYKIFPTVSHNNLMEAILNNPHPYSHNRMSLDLGLNRKDFYNKSRIDQFLTKIDQDFDLILLMEYFDESLILLRRWLCWEMSDILYIKKNVGPHKLSVRISYEQRERFRNGFAFADSRLYEYFYQKFWWKVMEESFDFWDEVFHFKSVLSMVDSYCNSLPQNLTDLVLDLSATDKQDLDDVSILNISSSKWNSHFIINVTTCAYMKTPELVLISHIRKLEYGIP